MLVEIELDSRHRTTLSKIGRPGKYLAQEYDDGVIVLEPATLVTEAQRWYDPRPDVQAAVEHALSDPQSLVRRARPRKQAGHAT
jgi:hypothetical protein